MIKNIIDCYKHIPSTINHYFAFMRIQKKITGFYMYYFHDLDKILMYIFLPFLGTRRIKKIHQKYNRHHINNFKSIIQCDYLEAIIDWECSRFTKKDKQMTAREYLTSKKGKLCGAHYENLDAYIKTFIK